jgi:hypothetical protein
VRIISGAPARWLLLAILAAPFISLRAEVLKVPADYPTIKSAVSHAAEGDTVLIEDGTYLEKNIVISKKVLVKAKNLFGATIYSSFSRQAPIFKIKGEARIEGFILKGSWIGIEQRDSPDVSWEAEGLLILGCHTGISIDDQAANVGSAVVRHVIIIGAENCKGISTNDARDLNVSSSLFVNCIDALEGYDHLSFRADDILALDCAHLAEEGTKYRPVPPATSRIQIGRGVQVMDSASLRDRRSMNELMTFLRRKVLLERPNAADDKREAFESIVALILAGALRSAGDHGSAATRYDAALAAARRSGNEELVWQALWGSALNEEARSAYGRAIEKCRLCVEHLERWTARIPAGIYGGSFLDDKSRVFELLIGLLCDRHRADPTGGCDRQAFRFAEKAKSLARLFPSGTERSPCGQGLNGGRGGEAAAQRRLASVQLLLENPDLRGQEKEALIDRLEDAEDELQAELVRRERKTLSERPVAPDLGKAVLDYEGARRRLNGDCALSYFLGEERSFAFLLTAAGLRFVEIPGEPAIAAKVDPYLRFLQVPGDRGFPGERAGRILYGMLVGPIVDGPGKPPRRLLIVPDGKLFYMPFETLVPRDGGEESDGAGKFFAESAEISYAASVTEGLARDHEQPQHGAPTLLAVGNSNGLKCDNRSRNLRQPFFPLSYVDQEIEALVDSPVWGKRVVLLGEDATEGNVKAALAERFDVIHLAAHGVIDDTKWWRSALLLGADPSDREDGFLTALEVGEFNLSTGLVVLSGCGTGLGPRNRGEGIQGLSKGFLRAGAGNLVVSLWSVDDQATARFMKDFYRFLADGTSPAGALAGAKRKMIDSGFRNPFYWAPFVLIQGAHNRR